MIVTEKGTSVPDSDTETGLQVSQKNFMNTKGKGEITQAQVMAALLKEGKILLTPFGDNQRYDLVIEENGKFSRVQCKTAQLKNGVLKFRTHSTNLVRGKWVANGYRGQVELFGVYCVDNDAVYLIPVDAVPERQASLKIEDAEKFRGPKVLAAA